MSEKLDEYFNLLYMNYKDAIKYLKEKYGGVTDNYFTKDSYQDFLTGKISKPVRGSYSRTRDGLYCHHVLEDRKLNLTNPEYCKMQEIPYSMHNKNELVYADLIEHLILHALITKKALNKYGYPKFGYPGLITYLLPQALDWYMAKNIPSGWQKNCYQKSYLEADEIFVLAIAIGLVIMQDEHGDSIKNKASDEIGNLIASYINQKESSD